MNALIIEWQESGQIRTETIREQQPSKHPGTVRLGRDPARCDIVLHHPTVSGLHIELFFDASAQSFALRNLRDTNPPLVDGRQLTQGVALLSQGSTIYLGQTELTVVAVALSAPNTPIPPTVLTPGPLSATPQPPTENSVSYGLQCPSCHRLSPYERLHWGCQWCGTSLAAATSVLITPTHP